MSTLALRTSAVGPAQPTRRRPNYALRRAVALVVAAAAVVALVAGAFAAISAVEAAIDLGGRPAAASEIDGPSTGRRVHVAQPGDTLWAIADLYRADVGRAGYVDALIRLNGGTAIQAGQPVVLP